MACFRRDAMALGLLVLVGGASRAQSAAQVYGVVDLGVSSQRFSGAQRLNQLQNGAMTTSFLGVRGREDLGDGWATLLSLESFLRADTGEAGRTATDPFWARNAWVGVSSPWATLRLGRQSTPAFLLGGQMNPFGAATGVGPYMMHTYMPSVTQPMITADGASDSAWSNAVGLSTRDYHGVSASALVAAGEGGTTGRRESAALTYAGGPLAGGLVWEHLNRMAMPWGAPAPSLATPARPLFTAASISSVHAAVSYDFGPAKAYAQYSRGDLQGTTGATLKLATTQLGTLVRAGLGDVLLSWAHTDKDQAGAASLRRDTVALGYDYHLSKRTDAYVVALNDKVTGQSGGNTGVVGLRHAF